QVLNLLKGIDGIGFCQLSSKDIVRHKLVKDIIKAYDEGKN
ncbi:MAG: PhoH family protein, partial [Candidatus Neomarinimicrobiota bacterium]|nr:PhoH family protein [Candidatus Neomarinimicrobiota bacterium]